MGYCTLYSKYLHSRMFFLRDSPTRFSTSSFFHNMNLPGRLTNGLKYFNCRFKKVTHWGMIPGGDWLAAPAGYHTPGSHGLAEFLLTRWGIIPWEIDLPGYHTLWSPIFKLKLRITRQILTKNENILTQCSVAKVSSNYGEKTGGQKSRWTVTLTWQYKCKISEQLRTEQEVTTTKTLGISTW